MEAPNPIKKDGMTMTENHKRALRERDALRAEVESYHGMLAIMHGDGGHYRQEHGHDKAKTDALSKYYALLAEVAELRGENSFLLAGSDGNSEIARQLRAEVEELKEQDEAHRDHIDMLHRDQKPLLDNFAALKAKSAKLAEALEKVIPLQGDCEAWGKQEMASIINAYAGYATEALASRNEPTEKEQDNV